MDHSRRLSLLLISGLFVVSGIAHFIFPEPFIRVVPPQLPAPGGLVLVSGVAEVLGAIGLLIRRTRRTAAIGLIVLLVAVWPANLYMLIRARGASASTLEEVVLWLRLPLQLVLIAWVWRTTRDEPDRNRRDSRV